MKSNLLLTICLIPLWFASKAQTQGDYIYLNYPISGNSVTFEASEAINMLPGFNYIPVQSSDYFHGMINPLLIFPPSTGITGGPSLGDNGVVGRMGGVFNIASNGSAVYNIPIEVPQGINGFQPQLALSYNSQAPNGIMGVGWNLAGLSAITRTD